MNKKIAILGTGANGSCAGADLTKAGYDVVLIDQWPAHVEAMRENGIRIQMPDEELHVPVTAYHLCDVCTLNQTFDIVFLMVKAYDTRWMTELIKPYLADDGLLVGAQNSMTVDAITEIVGPNRTIGCVVELSSELYDPGVVKRNTPPKGTWFALGSLDPSMDYWLPEIEAILKNVGKVSIADDILSAKWMKVVVNCMTMAVKSMIAMNSAEILAVPGMRDQVREMMLRSGAEALAAGQALGHKIQPIIGLTAEQSQGSNRFLENLLDKMTADVGLTAINAMRQDQIKGRRTEIDNLNGLVADESRRLGLDTPVSDVLVSINRKITAGELKPGRENLDLALSMLK